MGRADILLVTRQRDSERHGLSDVILRRTITNHTYRILLLTLLALTFGETRRVFGAFDVLAGDDLGRLAEAAHGLGEGVEKVFEVAAHHNIGFAGSLSLIHI